MSESLSKDILIKIFSFLNGWELAKLSSVCRKYNTIINDSTNDHESKSNTLWKQIVSNELTTQAKLQTNESYRLFYKRIYLGPRKMVLDHCYLANCHSTVKECIKDKTRFNYSFYAIRRKRHRDIDIVQHFDIILSYAARFGLEVLGRNILQLMAQSLDPLSIKRRFRTSYSHTIMPILLAADYGHYNFIRMLIADGCRLCGSCVIQWVCRGPAYWIEERFVTFLLKIYKYDSPSLLISYLKECKLPDVIQAAIQNNSSQVQSLLKEQNGQSMDEVYKISSLFFALILGNKRTFECLMLRSSQIDFWKGIYDIGKIVSYMICADNANPNHLNDKSIDSNPCIAILQQHQEPYLHMLEEALAQSILDGNLKCLHFIQSLHPSLPTLVEDYVFSQLQEIYRLSLNIIPIQLLRYGAPYHHHQLQNIIVLLPYLKRYKSTLYDFDDVESMISLLTMLNHKPFCPIQIAKSLPFYQFIQLVFDLNGTNNIHESFDSLFSYVFFTRYRPVWNDSDLQDRYNQVTTVYLQAIISAQSQAIAINKARTTEGKTLLHMAAESNNPHWVQCLLHIGADTTIQFGPDRLIAKDLTQCRRCQELLSTSSLTTER